jgi:hypothetical protein
MDQIFPKNGCAKFVATVLEEIAKEHIIIYWATVGLVLSHAFVHMNKKLKLLGLMKLATLESN